MKRLFAMVLCVTMVAGMLVGCGKSSSVKASKYVTMGDYLSQTVEVTYYTVTEMDIEAYGLEELAYYLEYYDLYTYEVSSKTTVEEGDTVDIAYTGYQDGVAFDGGSSDSYYLEIGSGTFIDGFEDGLIGVEVGETVDLNLTFPESYSNEDLAGADVVFTVTVNSIIEVASPDVTSDAFIQELAEVTGADVGSYEDYMAQLEDYLWESCEDANESALQSAIWSAVYDLCEVSEIPESMVETQYNWAVAYYEVISAYYGLDLETLISYWAEDEESFYAEVYEEAQEAAEEQLIYMAVAEAEGISVSSADLEAAYEAEWEEYGYDSADAMKEEVDAEQYEYYVLRQMLLDHLAEVMTVVETDPISYYTGETVTE